MDENFQELEREAFEAAFKGESAGQDGGGQASYGLNPMQAERDEMAQAFDSPATVREIDTAALPPAAEMTKDAEPEPVKTEVQAEVKTEPSPAVSETEPEFKTFGQAFKWHRAQNLKTGRSDPFDWKGKQYTTQLKSEAKMPARNPAATVKTAGKPAPTTLAQDKAREYTEAWQQAQKSKSYADRLAAEKALKVAEDAAAAQKEGKSVVFKRDPKPNVAEVVLKETLPDPTSIEYADVGGKSHFRK